MVRNSYYSPRDDTYQEFRNLRRRVGLSQHALAKRLGVHPSMIGLWETAQRPIPPHRVPQLARILGTTLAELSGRLIVTERKSRTGSSAPKLAPQRPRWIDPADPDSWARVFDSEAQDAAQRFEHWASDENARAREATRILESAGQARYAPAYEAICMGPSIRCRRGHYGCRSTHASPAA